jgi:hypothetical protein
MDDRPSPPGGRKKKTMTKLSNLLETSIPPPEGNQTLPGGEYNQNNNNHSYYYSTTTITTTNNTLRKGKQMSVFATMTACAVGTTVTVGLIKTVKDLIVNRKDRKHEAWTWKKKLKSFAWSLASLPLTVLSTPWEVFINDLGWGHTYRGVWYHRVLAAALVGIIAFFKPLCLATALMFYGCTGLYTWFKEWENDYHNSYRKVVSEFSKAEPAATPKPSGIHHEWKVVPPEGAGAE